MRTGASRAEIAMFEQGGAEIPSRAEIAMFEQGGEEMLTGERPGKFPPPRRKEPKRRWDEDAVLELKDSRNIR